MFALPVAVIDHGINKIIQGTLIKLPPELSSNIQLRFYLETAKFGWTTCPQGYHVYTFATNVFPRVSIPGLHINGLKNSNKSFYQQKIYFDKQQIESFSDEIANYSTRVMSVKNDEIALLVHDLRAFSSAIYNSALSAKEAAAASGATRYVQDQIETVIATHTMLSIRIDMIDLAADQLSIDAPERIPVYKKIDKVVRCFRPKASARNIDIDIFSPTKSLGFTFGPPLFELVSYSILDNAVKYSPDSEKIRVEVQELAREIVVRVISFGPRIRLDERAKIFQKGVRSEAALKSGREGTGVGLSSASELIDNHFGGSITIHQSDSPEKRGDIEFFRTEFEMIFPKEEGS